MTTSMPRTLFVGRQRTAPAWYRCALPAEFLGADWIAIDDRGSDLVQVAGKDGAVIPPSEWSDYDVVVIQQPRGARWVNLIRNLQRSGTVVLFEIDDYVHAVRKAADHDFKHTEDRKSLQALELAMRVCDGLICSTDWLARRYRAFNPRVFVCRNGLDLGRYAMTRPRRAAPVIGWAGATGHRHAVEPWLDAVVAVMEQRPEVGFVSIGQPFHKHVAERVGDDRCTGIPFTMLEAYPAAMTLMDIAIAPAGTSNFFRGKSDLRFLEAGALGIATVADPHVYPTLVHGETGLHAATPDEARRHLLTLVDDRELCERLGSAARDHVRAERDMRVMSRQWAEVIARVAGTAGGSDSFVADLASASSQAPSESGDEPLVTFVVPTIGRSSLDTAVHSLLAQTSPRWRAIVVGDARSHLDHVTDDRITYVHQDHQESAGMRRNLGVARCQTEWVAFLDDDDVLDANYVAWLETESTRADVVVFRMLDDDGLVKPDYETSSLEYGWVGISFAVRTQVARAVGFIRNDPASDEPHTADDFMFIQAVSGSYPILVSDHLAYYVNRTHARGAGSGSAVVTASGEAA